MPRGVEISFGRRACRPGSASRLRVTSQHAGLRGNGERIAGLDLLRLLAALAVVVFHYGYAGAARGTLATAVPEVASLAKYGFLGVDLFFIISGFVIAAASQGRTWRHFAVARTLRLYPGFVICMTLTAIVAVVFGTRGGDVTLAQWLANLTMFAPAFGQPFMDGAYWSIVVELVFYGWVCALIALGILERKLLTILAIWLAIAALNEVFIQSRGTRIVLCTEYAGLFASGILIQRLRAGERSLLAWGLLGLAFSLGALHAFEIQRLFARLYADDIDLQLLWVLHLGLYVLFLAGLWVSSWVATTPTVLTLGALTYPLYLLHQHVGYVLIDAVAPVIGAWTALAFVTGVVLMLAFAVQRWLEPAGRAVLRRALAAVPGLNLRPDTRDRLGLAISRGTVKSG